MSKYYSDLIKGIEPYIPGEQPRDRKLIKLNTNENPYDPSRRVYEAMNIETENLRLYPDPECTELRKAIGEYFKIGYENIFVGNGSDEVLAFAFTAFFSGKTVLMPDVTYSFYPVFARLTRTDAKEVEVLDDFSVDLTKYQINDGGIIIANPNAPTGRYIELQEIEELVKNNQNSVVVIDEAYIDFGGESACTLIDKYDNLLVVQTFSKSRSLAGMRVGFALGHKDLIHGLNQVKNSFNSYPLDRIAQICANASITDTEYFLKIRNSIIKTREAIKEKLIELGFEVIPSKANFLLIRHKNKSGIVLYNEMKEKGILVRHFQSKKIEDFVRVTIGTESEMQDFLKAIQFLIASGDN